MNFTIVHICNHVKKLITVRVQPLTAVIICLSSIYDLTLAQKCIKKKTKICMIMIQKQLMVMCKELLSREGTAFEGALLSEPCSQLSVAQRNSVLNWFKTGLVCQVGPKNLVNSARAAK